MKDPLTGEEFTPKKISQRFATPQNRIKYNNQKANKQREERAFIDKPLHKNHNILKEILGKRNEKIFHSEFLLGKGFDFKLFTNYDKWKGKNIHCIYEFMIIPQSDDQIKILKK